MALAKTWDKTKFGLIWGRPNRKREEEEEEEKKKKGEKFKQVKVWN